MKIYNYESGQIEVNDERDLQVSESGEPFCQIRSEEAGFAKFESLDAAIEHYKQFADSLAQLQPDEEISNEEIFRQKLNAEITLTALTQVKNGKLTAREVRL